VAAFLELSFDLGPLDAQVAESTALACGAFAVTFVDARDDAVGHPAALVLEPPPGEMPLWPETRVKCLFAPAPHEPDARATVAAVLAATLGIDVSRIETQSLADRAWEREWLKDFHAMRFGRRLWVCPRHERVDAPDAVVVSLDPGLAFGTGIHASTALCLEWLDTHLPESPAPAEHFAETQMQGLDTHLPESPAPAEHFAETQMQGLDTHLPESPAPAEHFAETQMQGLDTHLPESPAPAEHFATRQPPGARVIDYGCGSGVLGIAAARLGAAEVHAFDIDAQALIATTDHACANEVQARLQVHADATALPSGTDVLLANILAAPLCALAGRFAALVRPGGQVVLAGLMSHEAAEVTAAYATWFDVVRFGERDGWACLSGRRR
jgi:ribosomal protein L11 methylase PrmA